MYLPSLPTPLLPLIARGVRVFREPGTDRILTLPGRTGTVMLVPRGHGTPKAAQDVRGQFHDAVTGATCSSARWECAGSVAAFLRETAAPRPSTPVGGVPLCAVGVTFLRVHRLAITAARCPESASAVVLGGRVRAVNPRAAARGLVPGARACEAEALGVATSPPGDEQSRLAELGLWLQAEYGEVTRVRGGYLVRGAPQGTSSAVLSALVQLRARIWQSTGLTVRAVAAPDAVSARVLGRLLPGSHVAVVPEAARGLWATRPAGVRLRLGARAGEWHGAPIVDVEGVIVHMQGMLAGVRGHVTLRLSSDRGQIEVGIPLEADAGRIEVNYRIESALRRVLGSGKAIWAAQWRAEPRLPASAAPSRQVALWA